MDLIVKVIKDRYGYNNYEQLFYYKLSRIPTKLNKKDKLYFYTDRILCYVIVEKTEENRLDKTCVVYFKLIVTVNKLYKRFKGQHYYNEPIN